MLNCALEVGFVGVLGEMMVSTILVGGCAIFLRGVAQYYMCCVLLDFDKLLR